MIEQTASTDTCFQAVDWSPIEIDIHTIQKREEREL